MHNNPLSYVDPSGFDKEQEARTECAKDPECMNNTPPPGSTPPTGEAGDTHVTSTAQRWMGNPFTTVFRSVDFGGIDLGSMTIDWGGIVESGSAVDGTSENNGVCWNGQEGDWTDLMSGLLRGIGNELTTLLGYASIANPSAMMSLVDANPFGSNNTNMGIFGSDLAPAVVTLGTGGAGATRYAGLRAGTQGAREFLGLVGNRSIQMDHAFVQRGGGGNNYWNLFPTDAALNRLMGQANNYTLSNTEILRGALARFIQNGKLGATAGGSFAAGDSIGRAIVASGACN